MALAVMRIRSLFLLLAQRELEKLYKGSYIQNRPGYYNNRCNTW
jgi:hypothetical protein